jgi:FtsP/CotA-like multicopper oxidase with cupredoxin domain
MFEDRLPLAEFDAPPPFIGHSQVTIMIEARRVAFREHGQGPAKGANAWRYVRVGGKEDNDRVLDVALGPIFNVRRGAPLEVSWQNTLGSMSMEQGKGPTLESPPINPIPMQFAAPMWRGMNPSVGVVTHLHGARVHSRSDGWPLEPASFPGNPYGFNLALHYRYDNEQRSCMLWFHDHGMDNTAPQVHAGLAGLYFLRDDADDAILDLVGGQEIPLVVQDRKFACGFEGVDYWAGVPTFPADFDRSEYLGDTIFVNGRPSPFHEVERRLYRLRVVNGSHARTCALALIDPAPWSRLDTGNETIGYSNLLTVIGNDGGLFPQPQPLGQTDHILLAPGERLDLLLDLTGLQANVNDMGETMPMRTLRLVNLAVASAQAGDWPEAIFQTSERLDGFPKAPGADPGDAAPVVNASTILLDASGDKEQRRQALASIAGLRVANVLEFCIDAIKPRGAALDTARLATILQNAASEDGFEWRDGSLQAPQGAVVAKNRLVLLVNDTQKIGYDPKSTPKDKTWNPYAQGFWRDTQIWEMTQTDPKDGRIPFAIPFAVDLENPTPAAGGPQGAAAPYFVARANWFETYPPARLIDDPPEPGHHRPGYAKLHHAVTRPKAGTYERWYVANLGNTQSLTAGGFDDQGKLNVPDMHPFHMHLVNFVALRRWRLQTGAETFAVVDRTTDFDRLCRHDTIRIQSNEMLELLVFFPPGYTGRYPFHCHVIEHEDMGMMSHFHVEP